jgi:hypothetical protein
MQAHLFPSSYSSSSFSLWVWKGTYAEREWTSYIPPASENIRQKCSAITVYLIVYICEWGRNKKWWMKRNIKTVYM